MDRSPIKCLECGTGYKTVNLLLKHQCKRHSPVERDQEGIDVALRKAAPIVYEKPFICNQCGSSYKANKYLLKHVRQKHKQVKCEVEEVTIMVEEEPEELLLSTEETPDQCDQGRDSPTNNSFSQLRRRWPYTGMGINIECEQCGKKFPNVTRLKVHQRIHEGKTIHKCKYCEAEVLCVSQLKIHEKTHMPYRCNHCGERFISKANTNKHKREVHTDIYCTLYMCTQCGCKFPTRKLLTLHQVQELHFGKESPVKVQERLGDQPAEAQSGKKRLEREAQQQYVCKYCGKEYPDRRALEVHERRHRGERPFSCDHCDWTSTSLSNLRAHQNCRHPGEELAHSKQEVNKPFKCDYCGKGFRTRSHLKEHSYLHTEKPFNCEICGRGFIRENYLEQHQKRCGFSHFKCGDCGSSFSSGVELTEHRQQWHIKQEAPQEDRDEGEEKVEKYSCDQCKRSFSDPSSLAIHKCSDQRGQTLTCKDCGTVVRVGGTTLSNVFTVTELHNVKCFLNNHTLF